MEKYGNNMEIIWKNQGKPQFAGNHANVWKEVGSLPRTRLQRAAERVSAWRCRPPIFRPRASDLDPPLLAHRFYSECRHES